MIRPSPATETAECFPGGLELKFSGVEVQRVYLGNTCFESGACRYCGRVNATTWMMPRNPMGRGPPNRIKFSLGHVNWSAKPSCGGSGRDSPET